MPHNHQSQKWYVFIHVTYVFLKYVRSICYNVQNTLIVWMILPISNNFKFSNYLEQYILCEITKQRYLILTSMAAYKYLKSKCYVKIVLSNLLLILYFLNKTFDFFQPKARSSHASPSEYFTYLKISFKRTNV